MYVDPDEPVGNGRIVVVRAYGPGRQRDAGAPARRGGRGAACSTRRNPGRPDMEVIRANETMIRAVVVFVGQAV